MRGWKKVNRGKMHVSEKLTADKCSRVKSKLQNKCARVKS